MLSRTLLLSFAVAFIVGAVSCVDTAPPEDELVLAESPSAVTASCPTAPTWLPLSLLWWKTTTQLDRFVWSSDGNQIWGLELTFEEKKSWIPISGTTDKRKFCHRLFRQEPSGSRSYVGGTTALQNGELFVMQPAGYAIVDSFDQGNLVQHRWNLASGARTLIAATPDSCSWTKVLPSPDGARIASMLTRYACGAHVEPTTPATVTVQILDASGAPIGPKDEVALAGAVLGLWTTAGPFVVTSDSDTYAFAADGSAPVLTARPTCFDPPTTSSIVNAKGEQLDFVDGKIGVATMAPDRAFGCGL